MDKLRNWALGAGLAVASAVPFLHLAHAATSIPADVVTLPDTAMADVLSGAGSLFSSLWVFVVIAVAVPLAFYIIKGGISLVTSRTRAR
jgi:hypothetical protein